MRKASELYGFPKSTLYNRVKGRVQHGKKPGAVTYLTMDKENELASFLIRSAEIGYLRSINQVLSLVQQMLDFKQRYNDYFAAYCCSVVVSVGQGYRYSIINSLF